MNGTTPNPTARTAAGIALLGAGVLTAALLPGPVWLGAAVCLALGFGGAWLLRPHREPEEVGRYIALRSRVGALARGPDAPGAAGSDEDDLAEIERRLAAGVEREAAHRRRLLALLDAVDSPVVATDEHADVTLCNRAAAEMIGTHAEQIVGRPVDEAFLQADLLRLHGEARAGRAGQDRVRLTRPDGIAVFEASAIPVHAERPRAEHPVVMTLRDVTELSRAVQIKSDFVANASHELRTPIAALRIAVETLQGGAAEDPAMRRKLLGVMESNTGRLEEMVRDLLDLSRVESPDVPVRIGPVRASELREYLAPLFANVCRERKLTLAFDLDPALEGMRTDRDLVTLILKNLVENATKFAYEGTVVRVTGRRGPGENGSAAGNGAGGGGGEGRTAGAVFEVIDRGIGIQLGQQQRIFERYYQVDPSRTTTSPRRGTGLGLAIVKHAVRTLGGTIRVQSVWKQGTTMTVELPGVLEG